MLCSTTPVQISILVAARNEAHIIEQLLGSLHQLDYPASHLQILIGNDASTDNTAGVVADFIKNKPQFSLVDIAGYPNQQQGKGNVLMQLADVATGDYYFYTDADITVPPTWITALLAGFSAEKTGVVVGSTVTRPVSVFARCQGIEWLMALKFMETISHYNVPSTGMGNNMAVSRRAYKAVGGYENLPFSIVEDFSLYNAIIEKKFGFKHLYSPEVMAFTEPPENYFSQRKRWLKGGLDTRSLLLVPAVVQALTFPLIIVLFVVNQAVAYAILGISFSFTMLSGGYALKKAKLSSWIVYLPIYFVYVNVFWFLQLMNYALPGNVKWKGRQY